MAKESKAAHEGACHRGTSLPYVRPSYTRSLGPQLPAGVHRRLFYCSERPGTVRPGLTWARKDPKWPRIIQNGPGQTCVRIQMGSDPLLYAQGHYGHQTRPFGARSIHRTKNWFPGQIRPVGRLRHGVGRSKNVANKISHNDAFFLFFCPVPTSLILFKTERSWPILGLLDWGLEKRHGPKM